MNMRLMQKYLFAEKTLLSCSTFEFIDKGKMDEDSVRFLEIGYGFEVDYFYTECKTSEKVEHDLNHR